LAEIGIDDFAFRRGQRYGTIIVDHRTPSRDLLPERTSEIAAQGLTRHPGTRLITRDRAGPYARAASTALPGAVKVADRWHLSPNLHEALVRLLDRRHREVAAAAKAMEGMPRFVVGPSEVPMDADWPTKPDRPTATALPSPDASDPLVSPNQPVYVSKATALSQERRARRLARYEKVLQLTAEGIGIRAIAGQMRTGGRTVRKLIRAGAFPERENHRCRSSLDPLA
jgi:transposase